MPCEINRPATSDSVESMVLGKSRTNEPPTVPWRDVHEFEITKALWRRKNGRRKVERGRIAVRVPVPNSDPHRIPLVPCAYFHPKAVTSIAASRVYTDPNAEQLLFSMEKSAGENGETHYRVRDAAGGEVGLIRRIPPKTMLHRHNWVLHQPGRPEIVAHPRQPRRPRGLLADIVAKLTDVDDSGAEAPSPRILEWFAGGEHVMTSRVFDVVRVHAGWFDRRLAFAYAMLLDR